MPAVLVWELLFRRTSPPRGVFEMPAGAAAGDRGQWDMFCALIGATAFVFALSRPHDR